MRKPVNCAFNHVWKEKDNRRPMVMGWGVILVSFVVFAHFGNMPEPFRGTAWVLPVMCAATFFFAVVHEPRVMAVNVIWWMALLLE